MPAFFFNSDAYIHGRVMANYTSGAPVRGNLTLRATLRPVPQHRPRPLPDQHHLLTPRPNYNPYLYNETTYPTQDEQLRRYRPGQPNQLDHPDWWYDPQKVYTRVFNFVSIFVWPSCFGICKE